MSKCCLKKFDKLVLSNSSLRSSVDKTETNARTNLIFHNSRFLGRDLTKTLQ